MIEISCYSSASSWFVISVSKNDLRFRLIESLVKLKLTPTPNCHIRQKINNLSTSSVFRVSFRTEKMDPKVCWKPSCRTIRLSAKVIEHGINTCNHFNTTNTWSNAKLVGPRGCRWHLENDTDFTEEEEEDMSLLVMETPDLFSPTPLLPARHPATMTTLIHRVWREAHVLHPMKMRTCVSSTDFWCRRVVFETQTNAPSRLFLCSSTSDSAILQRAMLCGPAQHLQGV